MSLNTKVTLNQAIGVLAGQLYPLLQQVAPEPAHFGGVLPVALWVLPRLAQCMESGLAVELQLATPGYACAPKLVAGWHTVLALVARAASRRAQDDLSATRYNEGVDWVAEQLQNMCPALGADTGEEPLTFQIARVSAELHFLLNQVAVPSDEQPGGAIVLCAKVAIKGVSRNMAEGLYQVFDLMPPVCNPGFLPPLNWKALLAGLHEPANKVIDSELHYEEYHYREGVLWTCAKYRDTFSNLTATVGRGRNKTLANT
jgi:hypothetical protein